MNVMTESSPTPDWLAARGGELRRGVQENSWLVLLNGSPQYQLVIAPAAGKVTCIVTQTNNGKRLDRGAAYPDSNSALAGGLAELRTFLGWG